MSQSTLPAENTAGTTDATDATDTEHDCTCSALMPCFQCYRADRRGRPAIRRTTRCQ